MLSIKVSGGRIFTKPNAESVFKVTRQSLIYIQDLKEIDLANNLGYEILWETTT